MKRVFATIVTFNRPEMLKDCIAALLNQSAFGLGRIHVVVNSTDVETVDVIKSFQVDLTSDFITYECHDNPGPAGGFFYGLKRFLSEDTDYVWLMDDDVVVDKLCLRELLACSTDNDYIFPRVIKADGEEIVSFGWWGVLLARELVVKAGLPIPELFYWTEDTEYLQNRLVRVFNTSPMRCKTGMVRHLHQRKKKHPSWYYYYTTRNTIYYRTYIIGYNWHRIKRTLFLFPHSLFMILFKEDNKFKKIKLMIYGLYHGVIGKIGKLIDPSLNR